MDWSWKASSHLPSLACMHAAAYGHKLLEPIHACMFSKFHFQTFQNLTTQIHWSPSPHQHLAHHGYIVWRTKTYACMHACLNTHTHNINSGTCKRQTCSNVDLANLWASEAMGAPRLPRHGPQSTYTPYCDWDASAMRCQSSNLAILENAYTSLKVIFACNFALVP